jgi:hypothetical protein
MEEILTIADIAKKLDISSTAVQMRFRRRRIKPFRFVGSTGIYQADDMEAIREPGARGRPKAETAPAPASKNKAAPKAKPKKPAKKS